MKMCSPLLPSTSLPTFHNLIYLTWFSITRYIFQIAFARWQKGTGFNFYLV